MKVMHGDQIITTIILKLKFIRTSVYAMCMVVCNAWVATYMLGVCQEIYLFSMNFVLTTYVHAISGNIAIAIHALY